jgi:hypothetical protein
MKISSYAVLSNPQLGDKLIGTDVNNMDVTKNFTIESLFQLGSTSGLFVPYTGATNDVDLGLNSIRAVALIKDGGTSSQFLKADGTVDNNTYLTSSSLTGYVPYTGATTNVNLGANNITSNSFIKVGGTASQFLKANGTVDSSTYLTSSSLTGLVPYTGATANVNLGANSITANSIIKVGGTASQFLKADGTVDSTQYNPITYKVLSIGRLSYSGTSLGTNVILQSTLGSYTVSFPIANVIKLTLTNYVSTGINPDKLYVTSQQTFNPTDGVFQPDLEESNLAVGEIVFYSNSLDGATILPLSSGVLEVRIYD